MLPNDPFSKLYVGYFLDYFILFSFTISFQLVYFLIFLVKYNKRDAYDFLKKMLEWIHMNLIM